MKNSIHLMELILMILYIPMSEMVFYNFILKVEHFESILVILATLPLMIANLYYFLFVLSTRKYSIIKYIICTVLFLLLYVIIYIVGVRYSHYLPHPHLILFCISLSIAFFYYRGEKKKLVKAINNKL